MTNFRSWTLENLAKFAAEASNRIADQELELKELKKDLKAAINAYRELNKTKKETEQ